MSLVKAINEIQAEIDAFEKAIEVREGLIESLTRINGATGHLAAAASKRATKRAAKKPGRKTRTLSPEARERIAEAQRKRWAAQKRLAKKQAVK